MFMKSMLISESPVNTTVHPSPKSLSFAKFNSASLKITDTTSVLADGNMGGN